SRWHVDHGARMVDFAGFSMPVQYGDAGIQEEVRCVRERVGLFDLCHMGRLVLRGEDRVAAADHVLSQNVAKIPDGAIRYGLICSPDGGVLDDVLVYRSADAVHVVVNASNRDGDDRWFREQTKAFDLSIENVSDAQAMLALQGPRSQETLARACDADLDALKYYRFTRGRLLGRVEALVSRTGYTGEDGFELFFPPGEAPAVWEALLRAGEPAGIRPIGLGARDVCRTEAGMPLYGHEIDLEITGLEAGLGFGIDLEKEFIGRGALALQQRKGIPRRLVGLVVEGRRVPRERCALRHDGAAVGHVTSGTFSPTLDRPIAIALVRADLAQAGVRVQVDLRGRPVEAAVDALPFYSRKRKKGAL
ncbi:MAG: glycine cleavage system aminomethyltransferase GcvT, partial [Planctomycetota bacterium]